MSFAWAPLQHTCMDPVHTWDMHTDPSPPLYQSAKVGANRLGWSWGSQNVFLYLLKVARKSLETSQTFHTPIYIGIDTWQAVLLFDASAVQSHFELFKVVFMLLTWSGAKEIPRIGRTTFPNFKICSTLSLTCVRLGDAFGKQVVKW